VRGQIGKAARRQIKQMKKYLLIVTLLGCWTLVAKAQEMSNFHAYHPEEDASKGLLQAVQTAAAEHKHVFVQIGGNWCIWCARFYQLSTTDPQIDSAFKANYVVYHLNYSKENMNLPILAMLGYPQRFGFPVFVILNGQGMPIHTQNSEYLEQGKGYNKQNIISFLNDWSPKALDPTTYR
jgi:thiol:disulfide interchange protein